MDHISSTIAFDPQRTLHRCVPTGHTSNPSRVLWSTHTPDGPGTLEVIQDKPDQVSTKAWGPGQTWMTTQAPAFIGNTDSLSGFDPPERLRQKWRAKPFSLGQTGALSDALIAGVFGQKVQTKKAKESRLLLARRFGTQAPGPHSGFVLPPAEQLATMSYTHFHALGVEQKRASALLRAAQELVQFPSVATASPAAFKQRFEKIRGIGPWTTNMAAIAAFGDPDAVPLGDFHLPNTVAWNLAAEPRATDQRMLELLEPYAGHRWRVILLAKFSGTAPKYGPRLSLTDDGISRGK